METKEYWRNLVEQANKIRDCLDEKPDELKRGYTISFEGILNAYREGDLTFEEAKQKLAEVKAVPLDAVVMQKIAEVVEKYGLDCPNCNNVGYYGKSVSRYEYDDNGLPTSCYEDIEPVPCEFCYTEPRSKFNLENELKEKFVSNFSS